MNIVSSKENYAEVHNIYKEADDYMHINNNDYENTSSEIIITRYH